MKIFECPAVDFSYIIKNMFPKPYDTLGFNFEMGQSNLPSEVALISLTRGSADLEAKMN